MIFVFNENNRLAAFYVYVVAVALRALRFLTFPFMLMQQLTDILGHHSLILLQGCQCRLCFSALAQTQASLMRANRHVNVYSINVRYSDALRD